MSDNHSNYHIYYCLLAEGKILTTFSGKQVRENDLKEMKISRKSVSDLDE